MGLLTEPITLTFTPKQLHQILVVSCFRDNDPLRNILVGSLEAIRNQWEGKAEIIHKTAKNAAEFIEALNEFDGNIFIFDGHGAGNADTPVGKIMIADEAIDVWSLRGSFRTPPIVILSACDTHGIDASSQATIGNAFLGIGARTVLATLLPVDGPSSAGFIARLVYRIAEFIPAVLSAKIRVLNWTEIISGLLRMLLTSEILNALVGPPAPQGTPRARLQAIADIEINSREFDDWYERLLDAIAEYRDEDFETVRSKARNVLARSEAIRYVQLGNPETILIDDGEKLFRQFAVTISAAMLISALNALTLSPALCAMYLRHTGQRRGFMARVGRGIDYVRDGYTAIVRRLLRISVVSVLAVAVCAAAIMVPAPRKSPFANRKFGPVRRVGLSLERAALAGHLRNDCGSCALSNRAV